MQECAVLPAFVCPAAQVGLISLPQQKASCSTSAALSARAASCGAARQPLLALSNRRGGAERRHRRSVLLTSSFLGIFLQALLCGESAHAANIQRADCSARQQGDLVSWTHTSMMTLPISSQLFRDSMPTVLRCLYHPFVYGMASGKLPLSTFKNYVGQDAFFLNAFGDAYKAAGALASQRGDIAGQQEFQTLAAGVEDELKLHKAYAAKWKVELAGVQPNAVTAAYCKFVADIAAGGVLGGGKQDGGPKISHVCAALAPCMRLYAYLGQTLAAAGYGQSEQAKRDNPYAEWVDTYKTADFEGLARTLEDLLDKYAEQEQVQAEDLLPIYARAMELELAFFGAQPDVEAVAVPALSPAMLAVDFDQTLTEHDTTAVIVGAVIEQLPTSAREQMNADFNTLASNFYSTYSAKIKTALAAHPSTTPAGVYDETQLRLFFAEMGPFDTDALKPVVQGGFLKGVSRATLMAKGADVALQHWSLDTLREAASSGGETHIVSVNWSRDLIRSTLTQGLRRLVPDGSLEESFGFLPEHLHSPDLVYSADDVSIGTLSGPPSTGLDKLDIMNKLQLQLEAKDLKGKQAAGVGVVYVGDSVTDLLALLKADVGIVVGNSATLRTVAAAYKVELRPLVGALAGEGRKEGVLYTAANWHDIAAALYGPRP